MNARTLLIALGMCAASLPVLGCSSLSRPQEILITAEPAAAPKPAAAAPAQPAAPAAARPVAPPSSGG